MTEPETHAEYLWRERTKSGGEVDKTLSNVTDKPLIQPEVIKDCEHLEGHWVEINGNGHGYVFNAYCPKCGEKL